MATRIRLLGGLECETAGRSVRLPTSTRARSLLAYLALNQGRTQPRDYLAFTLWPDSTEEQARTNLRQVLFSLRVEPALASVLMPSRSSVELSGACEVDALQLTRVVARLPAASVADLSTEALADLHAAVDLYRGDLVPELADDWFVLPRERFRREVGSLLLALVTAHRQNGQVKAALACAARLAALDPFDEESHRLLIDLHSRSGRLDLARVVFDDLVERLQAELAVDPEPETLALGRRIQQRSATTDLRQKNPVVPAPALPKTDWPVVGRAREQEILARAWQQPEGQFVLLVGAAGIGKTTLLGHALRQLARYKLRALAFGRARPPGNLPFGSLIDAVRMALAQHEPTTWPDLPRPWAQALAAFLPELADLEVARQPPSPGLVLEAWSVLLRGLGPRLVLAIDDLHWADEATLGFLADRLEHLRDSGQLIVATARSEDIHQNVFVGQLLGHAQRLDVLVRIELEALANDESDALVRSLGYVLPEPVATAVARRAAGHPLFLVELARAAHADDSSADDATRLPESIRALVLNQVCRLSPDGQAALRALSVLGASSSNLLSKVLDWPVDRAVVAVGPAVRAQMVLESSAADGLTFRHDLVREAVAASLTLTEQRWLHRRAAEAWSEAAESDAAARVANHFLEAGEQAAALPWLLQAADADLQHATPELAAVRFQQAVDVATHLERHLELQHALRGLGRAELGVGRVESATRAFESARVAARLEGNRAAELEALSGLIEAAVARDALPDGLTLFRRMQSLPVAPGDAAAERALVHATIGCMVLFGLQRSLVGEGREHIRNGLQLATRLGDAHSARVLESDLVDFTTHVQGPWQEALQAHERLEDHFCAAWLLIWMGQSANAVPEANVALALARRAADYSAVANSQVFLGTALGLRGDYVSGFQLLEQAPNAARAYSQQTRLWRAGFRILLARELGLWPMVMRDAREHEEVAAAMGAIEGPFAGVVEAANLQAHAYVGGDASHALVKLRARAKTLVQADYIVDRLAARLAEADLWLRMGDPRRALIAADQLAEIAQQLGAARELAHAARFRALAAHGLGQSGLAHQALSQAIRLASEVGEPSLRWRVLQAAATISPDPAAERARMTAFEAIRSQLPADLVPMFGGS